MTPPRHGKIISILAVILVLAVIGVSIVMLLLGGGRNGAGSTSVELVSVESGGFDITIPTSGELAALRQTEIRNKLDSTRAVITEIIPEGTHVKAGDVLYRLSDEEINNLIEDAAEAVNNADNALINAKANLALRTSARASELARADLNIELARIALKAWEEGEDVSTRRRLALDIETAEKECIRRTERFEGSTKLKERGFTSLDEWKADEIAMIRAKADLEQARLAAEVYEKYTYLQNKAKNESDLEQAIDERERLETRLDTEVRSAEADVESREATLKNRQERLEKLQEQAQYTVMKSPSDGLVVYYSSLNRDRRGDGSPPEVGTELRPKETVIVLPDTSQMVAEVKVNEALSGRIREGQHATVRSDALPQTQIEGEVLSVGVIAEGGGWRDPNRRDYTVRILLTDAEGLGLKPSMRCRAEVHIGRVDDSSYIPVQSVFRNGPTTFVYVPVEGGFAERAVRLGRSSELYVEVLDGIDLSERVLLREPRYSEVVSRIGDDASEPGEAQAIPAGGPQRGKQGDTDGGNAKPASLKAAS
ncbi:MAG: HlyD family efflux transporter periplasmic adaptor subunit [Phycisphaerales bacterium]|nr:HlyD family efflux transporter periplasmic adaptor subunit [Phycisphaerales bacterium]